MTIRPTKFLRMTLIGDAAASGATGLLMALGAGLLHGILGLPEGLLRGAGLILLPYAAVIGYLGRREILPAHAVGAVIAANILWAGASLLLLFGGWISPTALGYAFVVFQAAVVAGFAEAQYLGFRRSSARGLQTA